MAEGRFQVVQDGAFDRDAGIAPGFPLAGRVAHPGIADAQAGDEADAAVHHQRLAVVAAEPAERAFETGRIEAADLDAGLRHRPKHRARGLPEAAEPVVEEVDVDSGAGALRQQVHEGPAGRVVVDDVVFELDRAFRRLDRFQPCRIVLGAVFQQCQAVAWNRRRAGNPGKRLACQHLVERPLLAGRGVDNIGPCQSLCRLHVICLYGRTIRARTIRANAVRRNTRRTDPVAVF